MKNQAFAFLKPHVMASQAIVDAAGGIFEANGVSVTGMRRISSKTILERGFFDKQIGRAAEVALFMPKALAVTKSAKDKFFDVYGEKFDSALDAGRILSPNEALALFAMTSDALLWAWSVIGAEDFGGDIYIGKLSDEVLSHCKESGDACSCGHHHHGAGHHHDCDHHSNAHGTSCHCNSEASGPFYVINGFYPSLREPFSDPNGSGIMIFQLGFDIPWRDFNEVVIGDENPAGALEESLRGFIYDRRDALNVRVDLFDNVIHASRSPFEALLEKTIWLAPSVWKRDPLCKRLVKSGIDADSLPSKLEEIRRAGDFARMVDGFDTPETAELLLKLLRDGEFASQGV